MGDTLKLPKEMLDAEGKGKDLEDIECLLKVEISCAQTRFMNIR